jgi:hypothetical protein
MLLAVPWTITDCLNPWSDTKFKGLRQVFLGANMLPIFIFKGVIFIIQRHGDYPGDDFFGQQNGFSDTHNLGKAVTETTNQVGFAAYNSDEQNDQNDQGNQEESRVKFVISKEMFILMGIAVCKIQ